VSPPPAAEAARNRSPKRSSSPSSTPANISDGDGTAEAAGAAAGAAAEVEAAAGRAAGASSAAAVAHEPWTLRTPMKFMLCSPEEHRKNWPLGPEEEAPAPDIAGGDVSGWARDKCVSRGRT
jgi:hypothetical protein